MPGDITLLLQRVEHGDREAADRLFRLVEAELRAIAGKRRRGFPAGLDAPTTLLVNEAFFRLVGPEGGGVPADRKSFFRFAAVKIHNLLVEIARAEQAQKRGGGRARAGPEALEVVAGSHAEEAQLLVDLQDALSCFEAFAPQDALLFRVRYFLGCTFEEAAEIVGVSDSEAKRSYQRAKLWLQRQLSEYAGEA